MVSSSAVFVGDGNLLIQCADVYRLAGHDIRAVVSANPALLQWAEAQGLRGIAMDAGSATAWPASFALSETADIEFDYLFSVANLHVLSPELIARARQLAINFHDALLPRYAGLNASAWALIAQETRHGVTWHEMTHDIDAGRIVRQLSFDISADETALSLNARCYEAGLASFASLVEDIGRGGLALGEQSGSGSYFGRLRRPAALATLDFSRPAKEIAALVRGLDFGHFPNPLGRPKIYLGDKVLLARSARVVEGATFCSPGTLLKVAGNAGDTLHIATGQGELVLGGCTDCWGLPAPHGMTERMVLPALDDALRDRLTQRSAQIARGEAFWRSALAAPAALELPYPRTPQTLGLPQPDPRQLVRVDLGLAARGTATLAGFFAWLSALTGQQRVSALYSDAKLQAQAQELECWLSHWVPLTLETNPEASVLQAAERAEIGLAHIHQAGPCPRDLPARLGTRYFARERLGKIAVSLHGAPAPDNAELLLTLDSSKDSSEQQLALVADAAVYAPETVRLMAKQLAAYLQAFQAAQPALSVAAIALLAPADTAALAALNDTALPCDTALCVHDAMAAQARRTPDQTAISCHGQTLSYRELEQQASALARRLMARGVGPGDIIGLCLERSCALVVGLLAILKTGAAYLPLDPDYPPERLLFMIEDSRTPLVLTRAAIAAALSIPPAKTWLLDPAAPADWTSDSPALAEVSSSSPAYAIYTSGSTGRPKGVVVTHRNVINFFAGMSARVPHSPPGRWLAVTSLSFDISVLELCWTLTRGFTVVIYANDVAAQRKASEFSLFYFASDHASSAQERYKLLLEGAKFADREGFAAVWTPERHFHAFGGLYPNPALTSAAIAAVTTRVKIRAGSCVLPLHHPIRVAEEWAFVDNISQGRVGVSFASGWQPNDFVIAPKAFASRKTDMLANIDVVRRLWRGESVAFPGPLGKPVDIKTLPRPIQKELPVWLTAAGNPETFQQAGELGCHLLTHLLGQTIEDVAPKLKLYRDAWQKAGHAGPGHVTLMLHTFVGQDEDAVREMVRGPMKAYLRSSLDLIKQAAWTFPTFVQRAASKGKSPLEIMDAEPLSAADMDALLEHAFSRYYGSSALFGTPARCLALVDKFKEAGVDEIACLIDFGVDSDTVLAHLQDLKQLMLACQQSALRAAPQPVSIAEDITQHGITHLQCTPSMASMLLADAAGRAALSRLAVLLVGGEALPLELARQLRALVPGSLLNMYGPTETTVWSTSCDLQSIGDFIPLGQPIANTRLHIHTPGGLECPPLVAGELLIGGAGVAQGYWLRPELNAERFVADPDQPGARLYRTGDLVRRHPDGALEFLGRIDTQVKIRGHRIELGEIESVLLRQPGVKQAVVVARTDKSGNQRLVAYVTPTAQGEPQVTELLRALAQTLPPVMLPETVQLLAALPMTPNGKVDRRALPEPQSAIVLPSMTAPESALEKTIAGIWEQVLGRSSVGTFENFFDLGGHSLLVVQVQRRLHEACGREVSLTDMFRLPTIQALAAHLSGHAISTAVDDGRSRANARRMVRSRARPLPTPAP
jgi:natural product biosynthesis luciferase-like monooxygenase protein